MLTPEDRADGLQDARVHAPAYPAAVAVRGPLAHRRAPPPELGKGEGLDHSPCTVVGPGGNIGVGGISLYSHAQSWRTPPATISWQVVLHPTSKRARSRLAPDAAQASLPRPRPMSSSRRCRDAAGRLADACRVGETRGRCRGEAERGSDMRRSRSWANAGGIERRAGATVLLQSPPAVLPHDAEHHCHAEPGRPVRLVVNKCRDAVATSGGMRSGIGDRYGDPWAGFVSTWPRRRPEAPRSGSAALRHGIASRACAQVIST